MTDAMMTLLGRAPIVASRDGRPQMETGADADLLCGKIGCAVERLMELEVGGPTGAAHGRRPPSAWSSATAIVIGTGRPGRARWNCASRSCGKARTFGSFLEPRRMAEKALTAVIQEASIQGISTCSVDVFLDRPIEGEWPYLTIDAAYPKVRRDGRIVSVAVIVAVSAKEGARRDLAEAPAALRSRDCQRQITDRPVRLG